MSKGSSNAFTLKFVSIETVSTFIRFSSDVIIFVASVAQHWIQNINADPNSQWANPDMLRYTGSVGIEDDCGSIDRLASMLPDV